MKLTTERLVFLLLILAVAAGLGLFGKSVNELKTEVAVIRERQSLAWYKQMIFEERVRGLTNSTLVVIGHSGPDGGYITIAGITEDMGVEPYHANTYVNVDADEVLAIYLRDSGGKVLEAVTLGYLKPGDLVIAWFSENPSAEDTSPDDWRLPATHRTDNGLTVAVEHFSGGTE